MSQEGQAAAAPFAGRTAWARNLPTPLREFLRTETGGAVVLLAATLAALAWANLHASSYDTVWGTQVSVRIGGAGLSQDLRHWVNSGLMTLFFFVVGLEARREFGMGELRDRRRLHRGLAARRGRAARVTTPEVSMVISVTPKDSPKVTALRHDTGPSQCPPSTGRRRSQHAPARRRR